jgi:hypothetical protein
MTVTIGRRELLAAFGGAAATWPLAVWAQQPRRVGVLIPLYSQTDREGQPLFYELRPELHAGRLPGADLFGADQGIGVVGGASHRRRSFQLARTKSRDRTP